VTSKLISPPALIARSGVIIWCHLAKDITYTDHPRLTLDPNVLTGKPVIRGTRLSVEFIIGLMRTGGVKQGNRVKNSTANETCEVVVIASGNLAADAQGIFLAGRF
jgi:Protein of unknown function (DUF433)